jgi:predicted acyltransferase
MLALGLIGLALFLWLWMPINKKMWSVPFALMMGGIGGLVIFICYYLGTHPLPSHSVALVLVM